MRRRTKIVCTLGPAVDSKSAIADLIEAGMGVARLNCSHGDWEQRARWIEWIRELSGDVAPVAILADLQGPKFRIGPVPGGLIELAIGQTVSVGREESADIMIPGAAIFDAMRSGNRLLLGDGLVELKLGKEADGKFEARVVSGGDVKSRQGVTLVGKSFDVPALTKKDVEDVEQALAHDVDFIALSYVREAADLRELRRLVERKDPSVRICAKIETREALQNIDGILRVADVVMVARGDLGLQVDLEDVPLAQKKIIERCNQAGRPVITATQMLESMLVAPRPTRAEASDVANAILDGTDAIMLSGETAAGQYPIQAVKTMARIATKTESQAARGETEIAPGAWESVKATEGVAQAAVKLADTLKAKAIVCTSTSGQTARMLSKFRPSRPILCASWNDRTRAQLAITWGVESIKIGAPSTADDIAEVAIDAFMRCKRLKVGDLVVVTAGTPVGEPGNTNLIMVVEVK